MYICNHACKIPFIIEYCYQTRKVLIVVKGKDGHPKKKSCKMSPAMSLGDHLRTYSC